MAQQLAPSSLSEKAYSYLQEQLIRGRWGLNERISEKLLADEFGISRTPVREAIRRMTAEGLLYQVPSSGTFVTNPDRESIVETFEVRCAIEGFAAEKAANLLRASDIRELQRLFSIMLHCGRVFRDSGATHMGGETLDRYLVADRSMHAVLLTAADNRLAAQIVNNGRTQTLIYGLHSYERDLRHVANTLRSHGRVLRAVKRGDGAMARRAMEGHIRNSMRDALLAHDRRDAIERSRPRRKSRPAEVA